MKKAIIPVIIVFLLVVLVMSTVVTRSNEYTLIKQFGRVDRIVSEAGLSFKLPFVQQTEKLPKTIMLYDQAESDVITKDKKTMVIDNFVLWRITDPLKFVQTLSTIAEAERRIETVTYNAIKNAVGTIDQTDIINGRDASLSEGIVRAVQDAFNEYGIEIIDSDVKRLDLPEDNKESVYARMISERNQIAADFLAHGNEEYQKIINETDKEVSIIVSTANADAKQIIAEGEAEYMRILAEAYNTAERQAFYEYLRSLDALKVTMKGGNKTLFLPIGSPLTKIFIGE